MAFDATERLETAIWRPAARRAADARQAADSSRPRFGDALAQADSSRQRPAASSTDRNAASDRAQSDRRDTSAAERRDGADHTSPAHSASHAPDDKSTASTDRTRQDRDQAPAQDAARPASAVAAGKGAATGKQDKPADKAEDKPGETPTPPAAGLPTVPAAAPQQATAILAAAGSQAAVAGSQAAAGATDGDEAPAAAPVAAATAPVQSPLAPSAPGAAAAQAAAVAEAADGDVAVAAGDGGSATGEATAKDFLAALADTGEGAGRSAGQAADPAGATPTLGLASSGALQGTTGSASAAPAHAASAAATAAPAVPLGQVPMAIGLRSLAGSSEFQIRLDPAELGRIDVTLEIDKAKGTVATHLVVDRADTLALLQRDAGQLQQALTQAGLDPSAGGVNLSLRSDGGGQANGQPGGQTGSGGGQPGSPWAAERTDTIQDAAPVQMLRGYGGLDIRI